MIRHTPGPWIADLRGGCCAVYPEIRKDDTNGCHSDDDRNIYYSSKDAKYNGQFWDMSSECRANACLIAAAPELLEQLIHLIRLLEPLESYGSLNVPGLATLNGARSAVDKANGEIT